MVTPLMHLLKSFERLYSQSPRTSKESAILMSAFIMWLYAVAIENFMVVLFKTHETPADGSLSIYAIFYAIAIVGLHVFLAYTIHYSKREAYDSIASTLWPALAFSAVGISILFLSLAVV